MQIKKLNLDTKSFLSSSMDTETALLSANSAVEYYKTEMRKLFPIFMVQATVRKVLGGDSMYLVFANVGSKDEAPNNIMDNVSGYFTIVIDVARGEKYKPIEKFEAEMVRGGVSKRVQSFGVKSFRKISGADPIEVTKKVVKWYATNKEALESLPVSVY
jgi:hypothetical protein